MTAKRLFQVTAVNQVGFVVKDIDRAMAAFSLAYADQNEKDHAALARAVKKGKVKAVFETEQ